MKNQKNKKTIIKQQEQQKRNAFVFYEPIF